MITSFWINSIGRSGTMSLLTGSSSPAGRLVSSGLIVYRKIVRFNKYEIDYSDDGGTTWSLSITSWYMDEDIIMIGIDDSPAGYRDLVRLGAYVIDQELTPTGFAGTEDIDWVQVYYLKPQ